MSNVLEIGKVYDLRLPIDDYESKYYPYLTLKAVIPKGSIITRDKVDEYYNKPAEHQLRIISTKKPDKPVLESIRSAENFAERLRYNSKVDRYIFYDEKGPRLVIPETLLKYVKEAK